MVATDLNVYDVQCRYCGVVYQILANRDAVTKWLKCEGYIQDLLPDLTPAERELMITATCETCWINLFGECLDDDEE